MKVGDLVKIAPHCANKHRMAIVVRTEDWDHNGVWIRYMDGLPAAYYEDKVGAGYAMINNLILLSEGAKNVE
jgi:hypothetical protein